MVRMRNLAIALSVGFLGVAGCSSEAGNGQIQLTWSLQDQATGAAISCAAGEHVDVTAGGITDSFNCADMSGITGALPTGTYAVTFDLVLNGTVESTVTMPSVPVANRSITDVGHILFIVANGPPPPGGLLYTWEIRVGSAGGASGTCAPSGEMFLIDLGGGMTFQADCPANQPSGQVNVPNVPVGTYNVNIDLRMGATVESQAPTFNGVTVASSQNTDLGHIIFVVTAQHR
jgi:hypothetical protein